MEKILTFIQLYPWLWHLVRIVVFFFLAWIIQHISSWLVRPIISLLRLRPGKSVKPERRKTLKSLIASGIGMLAYIFAGIASIALYVDTDTLVWMIGLFSAAFGLGARPIISDVLTGIGFIFEDTFSVGEKVEILEIEGIIEELNLRTTHLRAPSGELYVIPNGEIRMMRNFSRGRFSTTNIHIKIFSQDITQALSLLEEIGNEAVSTLPNLLEPWQVISEGGVIGSQTELTVLAKARFGKAAEMRPRILALLQERFADSGLELVD
jgi:small conductance mechanosensitive channel